LGLLQRGFLNPPHSRHLRACRWEIGAPAGWKPAPPAGGCSRMVAASRCPRRFDRGPGNAWRARAVRL